VVCIWFDHNRNPGELACSVYWDSSVLLAFVLLSEYLEWSADAHLRLLCTMGHVNAAWWRVNGSTTREPFSCTHPLTRTGRKYRFSSLTCLFHLPRSRGSNQYVQVFLKNRELGAKVFTAKNLHK